MGYNWSMLGIQIKHEAFSRVNFATPGHISLARPMATRTFRISVNKGVIDG